MKAAAILLVALALAARCGGQEPPSPLPAPPPGRTEHHRILHLIPTYDVTSTSVPYHPLSAKQKFGLMTDRVFDRFTLARGVVNGAFNQALDTPSYGQGWDAYGARVGASIGDASFHDLFSSAVFPSLFRQDPRYFRSGQGKGSRRFWYAVSRVFLTRNDSGRAAPNVSQWAGSLAAAGLSNVYYPARDRTAGQTLSRAGEAIGIDAGVNVLKEFWPDLHRKFRHRKR